MPLSKTAACRADEADTSVNVVLEGDEYVFQAIPEKGLDPNAQCTSDPKATADKCQPTPSRTFVTDITAGEKHFDLTAAGQ